MADMKNFFLKSLKEKDTIFNNLRRSHSSWKNELHKTNKPFFAIHTDFKYQFLKDISGGALKLYLYLGFHAKYQTGELWHTTEEISLFFDKDQRTVGTWFKELEDSGLIFREQKGFRMKSNTFLRPYGFVFDGPDMEDEEANYEAIVQDINDSLAVDWHPAYTIIMNNYFTEYTVVIIYKEKDKAEDNRYHVSYFINFSEKNVKHLRVFLKKYGTKIDNFDIDSPLMTAKNKDAAVYNHIMKYLEENNITLK
ncbi:MAG: helix-turn-helix domain-containing protein [Candidatus Pristimantibacillus sp.]